MSTLSVISCLSLWVFIAAAYDGTTTFDSILVAHPAPTICPPVTGFNEYRPDGNYIACCNHWYGTHTLTSGLGPGAKTVYACCKSGYTCTAPVSLMKDWSIDSNSDLQTFDIANPPTPTGGAAAGTTTPPVTAPPSRSTGTVSQPGATPIATSSGVVIYVYTNNENNNKNEVNIGSEGTSLSAGAIAGITVACTAVMAIAAVFAVKYARRQANAQRLKAADATAGPKDKGPEQAALSTQAASAWSPQQAELSGQYYNPRY